MNNTDIEVELTQNEITADQVKNEITSELTQNEITVEQVQNEISTEINTNTITAESTVNEISANINKIEISAEILGYANKGPRGKSAYDVAVEEGYEGTEEQWLSTLVGPQGEPGIQGEPGESVIWLGAYSEETTYEPNSLVEYLGSTYISILETMGNLPTDTTYWSLMVEKGDMLKSVYDPVNGNKQVAFEEDIPTGLSELSEDTTHRVVTDTEKSTWSGKQDALVADTDYLTPGTASTTYQPIKGDDDNYVTDAQLIIINNTSGTNSGDDAVNSNYSSLTQYTDELAQDAVGTILTDSAEIDFTYTDATPSITASIKSGSIDETKLNISKLAINQAYDEALGGALQVNGVITSLYHSGNQGGEIQLGKPASGTSLTANTIIDISDNNLRFYHDASPYYGAHLPLNTGVHVDTNKILIEADTVNNLTSTSTTFPLSANQGKVLNDKLYKIGVAISDLNNATTNGCYCVAGGSNAPPGVTYATVFVVNALELTKPSTYGYCNQTLYDAQTNNIWYRKKIDSGAWSTWLNIYNPVFIPRYVWQIGKSSAGAGWCKIATINTAGYNGKFRIEGYSGVTAISTRGDFELILSWGSNNDYCFVKMKSNGLTSSSFDYRLVATNTYEVWFYIQQYTYYDCYATQVKGNVVSTITPNNEAGTPSGTVITIE